MSRSRALTSRRPFRLFLTAGAFSVAAPSAVLLIVTWAITGAYPAGVPNALAFKALALTFLGISATVPTLLSAVFSGTLADRADRPALMRITNAAAIGAAIVLVGVLLTADPTHVPLPGPSGFYLPRWVVETYPLWAVITTAATIFRPTFNASLPRLVSTAELGTANGLIFAWAVGASVTGSLVGTGLVTVVGAGWSLLVPIAFLVIAQSSLLRLGGELSSRREAPRRRFLADAKEGYRYLGRRPALLELTISALLINFLSAIAFVELGLYVRVWLAEPQAIALGAMVTGSSIGAATGTVLVNRLHFERRAGRVLAVLTALQGVTVVALAFVHTVWLAVPDMFLYGLFPGMFTTVFLATVQATVPNELLGRVLAADEVGSYGMVPVGQYAGGLLTLAAGIQPTYLLAGAGTVAVGGLMSSFRALRRLHFEPKETSPSAPPSPAPSPPGGSEPAQAPE